MTIKANKAYNNPIGYANNNCCSFISKIATNIEEAVVLKKIEILFFLTIILTIIVIFFFFFLPEYVQ